MTVTINAFNNSPIVIVFWSVCHSRNTHKKQQQQLKLIENACMTVDDGSTFTIELIRL